MINNFFDFHSFDYLGTTLVKILKNLILKTKKKKIINNNFFC